MKIIKLTTIAFLMLIFSVGLAFAESDSVVVNIVVSPNVVNLESEGTWATVHAEIAYGAVASMTVCLDGIPVDYTKADNRGELVAKFYLEGVKDYLDDLELGQIDLELSGLTTEGVFFSGIDTITVINPTGKK